MSVKILRTYVVTLLDLPKESSVNEGNKTARLFSLNTVSCHAMKKQQQKCSNSSLNVTVFQCDNTVSSHALPKQM